VSVKKPDPAIYALAAGSLGLDPGQCVVIEDSNNGLRAALAAGMRCIVTMSYYTSKDDFTGADMVLPELGDPPNVRLTVADCYNLCRR
jgi:beta-phosphoglucomutase-like phosphatase (HAD superfamily)